METQNDPNFKSYPLSFTCLIIIIMCIYTLYTPIITIYIPLHLHAHTYMPISFTCALYTPISFTCTCILRQYIALCTCKHIFIPTHWMYLYIIHTKAEKIVLTFKSFVPLANNKINQFW